MAQETRVGLLVGMGFIICFAIILSNRGGLDRVAPQMPYQLFGAPGASGPRSAATAAQDRSGSLYPGESPSGVAHDPPMPFQLPVGVSDEASQPMRVKPAGPVGAEDPERFIQRRRSLLPSRELAAAGGDVARTRESADLENEELASSDTGDSESVEFSDADEAGDVDSDRAQLPAGLVVYSDQLEVVSSDGRSSSSNASSSMDSAEAATGNPAGGPDGDSPDLSAHPGRDSYVEHVVSKGDSLSRIAQRYYGTASKGVMDAIVAANRGRVRSANALVLGRTLRLPPVGDRIPVATMVEAATSPDPEGSGPQGERRTPALSAERDAGHAVLLAATSKPGQKAAGSFDSSSGITSPERHSKRTTKPSVSKNSVEPQSNKEDHSEPSWRWYTVKKGDLYSTIAQQQLGTSKRWRELLALNKDVCPDAKQLRQGVQIRIPNGALADAR